jgi:endonuclease/exonuclease/phosphatase family metal-dependent hydrolase
LVGSKKFNIIFLICFLVHLVQGQNQILLDENISDWDQIDPVYQDQIGDGVFNGVDFSRCWIENDDEFVYFQIEMGIELNFQSNNDLAFYIDIDNNVNTGFPINGIGADLRYFPGLRFGFIHLGNQIFDIRHDDIGLMSSPTVSSDFFEIAIRRSSQINGLPFQLGNQIRISWREDIFGGDRLPNENGGILFEMTNQTIQLPEVQFDKFEPSHLRVISHNALQDGMFELGRKPSFERLLQATQPDIIGYQEIYSNGATAVKNFVSNALPGFTWYSAQMGPDVFVVSKFPIVQSRALDGNGAFLIDLGDRELLFIVAHLPCCDNESQRQSEADRIMGFVRDAKAGIGSFVIDEGTPIVILGDMNLVGFREQQQTLITGNIDNEVLYGPDFLPDWDDSDLEDAIPIATGLPAAVTWVQPFSSFSPGRLDYILYTGSQMNLENTYAIYTEGMKSADLDANALRSFDSFNASDHLLCVADFSFDIQTSASHHKKDISNLKLYPNPASNWIFLDLFSNQYQIVDISISNSQGKLVFNNTKEVIRGTNKIQLNVQSIPVGSYFIHLDSYAIPFIKH